MKKTLCLLFLISFICSPCFAEYREIPDNVWINAPIVDYNADLLIDGASEDFRLSFNDTYTISPIRWDVYSSKHVGPWDNTAILYLTLIADEQSTGILNTAIINAFSTNPLIPARAIVTSAYSDNPITISSLAVGNNAVPAQFTGIGTNAHVLVDCDLWVTGQIINPASIGTDNKIKQLEDKIYILEEELKQYQSNRLITLVNSVVSNFKQRIAQLEDKLK